MDADKSKFDVENLAVLESPKDILKAVADLSRRTNGLVMVHLRSANDPKKEIWFNPKYMQEELDSRGSGNVWVKFQTEVEFGKYKIDDVTPLDVNASSPFPLTDALEKFGDEHGFKRDSFDYAGRWEPKDKN